MIAREWTIRRLFAEETGKWFFSVLGPFIDMNESIIVREVTTVDNQTLLPCPFCGHTEIRIGRESSGHGESCAFMECKKCGAKGPSDYHGPILDLWNSRTPMDSAR